MSVNKVILVGRVGQEPNVRMVGDKKVATINLATSEKYKGRDGNLVENTEWHCVVLWDRIAEVAEKYVTKGTQLYIEGKIKTEMYTNKEGQEKVMVRIKADNMQMLSGTKQQDNAPASAYAPKSTPFPTYDNANPTDDLPF